MRAYSYSVNLINVDLCKRVCVNPHRKGVSNFS